MHYKFRCFLSKLIPDRFLMTTFLQHKFRLHLVQIVRNLYTRMSGYQKMIIDVDTGIDDAQAIMMALSRKDVTVLGVTCVRGNVGLSQVCHNTLRVLKACDQLQVPVFRGVAGPLIIGDEGDAKRHHGEDGLGDVPDVQPKVLPSDIDHIQSEDAIHALIRLTNEHPGEITLVALAPLTNIALALKLDPFFGKRLKQAVLMGGNIEGKGNTSPAAEFNFFSDPEAAYITLRELSCPITLVSWETCLHNALSWDWFDKWRTTSTSKAKFNFNITANAVERLRNTVKIPKYRTCDALAMAVAIDDRIILESQNVNCDVELQGKLTRGQMVVDWSKILGATPNVSVVTKVDVTKYETLMEQMLL